MVTVMHQMQKLEQSHCTGKEKVLKTKPGVSLENLTGCTGRKKETKLRVLGNLIGCTGRKEKTKSRVLRKPYRQHW